MNRSSTPKGSAPVIKKPVHIPNQGVAEAPSAFLMANVGAPQLVGYWRPGCHS